MVLQSLGNEAASLFRRPCFHRPRTEVAQHIDTLFADHLFSDLTGCRNNAADAAQRALARNGLYALVKCVSSTKPCRLICSSISSIWLARPQRRACRSAASGYARVPTTFADRLSH